jgi:hypothetical protein
MSPTAAGLLPHPLDHRRRTVDPLDGDAARSQRHRDPPGADSQFQHPAALQNEPGRELDRERRVEDMALIIFVGIAVAEEGRAAEARADTVTVTAHAEVSTNPRAGAPANYYWALGAVLRLLGSVAMPSSTPPIGRDEDLLARLSGETRSKVTFTIEESGEVVKLTVVHDGVEMTGYGWPNIIASLKTLLEPGESLPEDG